MHSVCAEASVFQKPAARGGLFSLSPLLYGRIILENIDLLEKYTYGDVESHAVKIE